MLSLIHKQGRLNRMLINVMFNVSKMANYASEPRHDPTVGIWEYGDGVTPSKLKVSIWNVNGLRSVINKG
jgi:hypothetical protein